MHQLRERIDSQLFERTAISRKPEQTIRHDIEQLRQDKQISPSLLLKDPYVLDFLGLNDRYLERVRIPVKLDSHSTANWTLSPVQTGHSERSDAGVVVLL